MQARIDFTATDSEANRLTFLFIRVENSNSTNGFYGFIFGRFKLELSGDQAKNQLVPRRFAQQRDERTPFAQNLFSRPYPKVTADAACKIKEGVYSMQLKFTSLDLKSGSLYHFLAKCDSPQTAILQEEFRIDPSRMDLTGVFFYGSGKSTSHDIERVILRVVSPKYGYAIVFAAKERFLFSAVQKSYYKQKTITISRKFSPFKGKKHPRPTVYLELECSSKNSTKSSEMPHTFYLISNDLNKADVYMRRSIKCGKEERAHIEGVEKATDIINQY